jgi:hypothetical protein
MSNYTKATNFATKDTLLTGDANKIVKGTEIDNEFNAISGAITSKADVASPTFTGTPAAPTAASGTNTTQLATTAFVTTALQAVYPVGSIYINASSASNPSTLLGFGTWTAFGAGRVMVGLDAGDALFDTAEETGGSKDAVVVSHTHTLSSGSTESAGSHQHFIATNGEVGGGEGSLNASNYMIRRGSYGSDYNYDFTSTGTAANIGLTSSAGTHTHTLSGSTASTGVSGTNANVQPYITVRMWKRTA